MPLHLCFKKHDDVFGMLYSNLIKVGEESGRLVMVLDRLDQAHGTTISIRRRVIGAMTIR